VKANTVLLRFDVPTPAELVRNAEAYAVGIDTEFLWECCGESEFDFATLAREYCGHPPSPVEAAGILLKLHSAPMYFYRKGRGRYKAAQADTLKAALASADKKLKLKRQVDEWAASLAGGEIPEAFKPILPALLYKPDRNRPETKALEKACEDTGLSPAKLFGRAGALPSSHDFHFNRFLFEFFPSGTAFPDVLGHSLPGELPVAQVAALSLDDASTTEIDDAFSVTPLDAGRFRIGIHIAAPGLGFVPGSPLDGIARARLSTVYTPGRKITMLPPEVVECFTLAEGRASPAISLYLDVRGHDFVIEREHTAIERVPIAANLRHQHVESLDQAFQSGDIPSEIAFAPELHKLWRFAESLEVLRGKPANTQDRAEYSFHVEDDPVRGERISISKRPRGTPLDKLVTELMIFANSSWGRLLDDNSVAAVYRVQTGGRVHMATSAGPHQGLGISHYAWTTSPLRRYVDLINQWQLLALLRNEAAPFARNGEALLAAVYDFETCYAAYADFQSRMERYWCLRWLDQESIRVAMAEVVRDNLVRLCELPLYLRVPSLPQLDARSKVHIELLAVDLLECEVRCRFDSLVS
jgi:exoribonuclease-2